MKNIKFFILLLAVALISCERDDICAEDTATTPRLLIEFYDLDNTEDLKAVPRITVYGEGTVLDENGMVTVPETEVNTTLLFNENATSVELPLQYNVEGIQTTTRFILERDTNLRLDTDSPETSNVDIIEITYTPEFIYVSRACGYKSIFNELDVDIIPDGEVWISGIEIVEQTIENENTVHVRILH